MADDMRGCWTARIEAAFLRAKADAGYSKGQNVILLSGCQLASQPLKLGFGCQFAIDAAHIQLRQNRCQPLDDLIRIGDLVRLGIERNRPDIRCEDLAVAVKKVWSRCHQGITTRNTGDSCQVAKTILHQATGYHPIDQTDTNHHQNDTVPGLVAGRLARTIDNKRFAGACIATCRRLGPCHQSHALKQIHYCPTDPVMVVESGTSAIISCARTI